MRHDRTLEELWAQGERPKGTFSPESTEGLPPTVRRYLNAALAPGAPLATTVRLEMNGAMRMGETWHPFEAEQVICWERGFVWAAKVRMRGIPVTGFDRLVDGEGQMRWRLLGLVPLVRADGEEITRSATGRLHVETIWLPATLLSSEVRWSELDGHPHASIRAHGETSELDLELSDDGALRGVSIARWGQPEDEEAFGYHPFGGTAAEPMTVEGITIPTVHRVGWYYGTERFEQDGAFFRCTITSARFKL